MMENALEVKGLCKQYQNFTLKDISFSLPMGTILGLVGQNGAGKTTTIKAILDIVHRSAGEVSILGKKGVDATGKEEIGVVFDECCFHDLLNAEQIGKSLSGIFPRWDAEKYMQLLEAYHLKPSQKIKEYSRGMKMKLSIAAAMAHKPRLLILDEPTGGLDPVVRSEILDTFQSFIEDGEHAILLSSHITTDLDRIADYIMLIDGGMQLLFESKDELLYGYCILKGGSSQIGKVKSGDALTILDNGHEFQALCRDRARIMRAYPEFICDKVTIEDIMVLLARGV